MTTRADGRGGSMPPRPAAAGQCFVFKPWLYDVDAAIRLLHAAPRPPQPLPVQPWALAYGLIRDPGSDPHAVSLIGPGPGFDPGYAMTTDLDDPVIIATITIAGGKPAGPLLTDAYARPVTVRNSDHLSVVSDHWRLDVPARVETTRAARTVDRRDHRVPDGPVQRRVARGHAIWHHWRRTVLRRPQ